MEEIILKRATAKLKLTSTVIEGGQARETLHCCIFRVAMLPLSLSLSQFTHGTVAAVAEGSTALADILKFGLDHLLQSDERYVHTVR